MALAVSSDGWTAFSRSADTRVVFVSSSRGSDSNDGLSRDHPKRTLPDARALLRHGYPDWLLLRRGDVWQQSLGQWKKSGRSATEPMLISTYGGLTARPMLRTGATEGITTSGGNGSPATIDHLAIIGIHFHANGYVGASDCAGGSFLQPSSNLLIEDCMFEGYSDNLVVQGYGGRHTNVRLRRSVIVDAWTLKPQGGHSEGMYAYAVDGLLIEENVFDHNGWNETVPGAGADVFCHNLYIDNGCTGVAVRGNIISRASSHGMQLRCGGIVEGNLFARNPIALSVGGGNDPEPSGILADVRGNVIVEGTNIDADNPRGWGLWIANIRMGSVTDNLISGNVEGLQPQSLTIAGDHKGDTRDSIGVHNTAFASNIVSHWGGDMIVIGDAQKLSGLVFSSSNDFSGAEKYVAPRRSIASYMRTMGMTPSTDAFLAEARLQSWMNRRPTPFAMVYSAAAAGKFIRDGFARVV